MNEKTEDLKTEIIEDGIALATLNRPDHGNAESIEMRFGFIDFLHKCNDDDDVRVIVVTGAGKTFCVGADLSGGKNTFGGSGGPRDNPDYGSHTRCYGYQIKKPIIGAINGHAVGVGLTLILTWDILIVAEDAKLGFPFTRRGIAPELGSTWILPRMIGMGRSLDLMLRGRIFSGTEAASYGLALEALPADQVLPRALEIAREIRDYCAPVSVAMTKKLLWDHLKSMNFMDAVRIEDRSWKWAGKQPDAREGVISFLEKRRPKWSMRITKDWPDFLEDTETEDG